LVASAKILAVDDEPDFELLIRQRFRRQIRDEEFEFRFAHHGEEALSALSAEPDIELMLLDINMPVMDGLTLLNELRERQLAVQAIIVSAYGDMTNLRTAMNRGAFDFVTKPVDLSDLEITVRKALANIAKLREMDRQRRAAERARNNLSRYFSPTLSSCWPLRTNRWGLVVARRSPCCLPTWLGLREWRKSWLPKTCSHYCASFIPE
jgi:adenylate cyclase